MGELRVQSVEFRKIFSGLVEPTLPQIQHRQIMKSSRTSRMITKKLFQAHPAFFNAPKSDERNRSVFP
jgi:hypothetical protein